MPTKKNNKTEILADIVRALRDLNTTVQVQTIDVTQIGPTSFQYDGRDHSPTQAGKKINGTISDNARFANSIKINDDIQIQKKPQGKFETLRFIVHTPHGELNVPALDNDTEVLWGAALGLYEAQNNGQDGFLSAMHYMYKYIKDPTLRKIAGGPATEKDNRSIFARAKAKLAALGIGKTKNLDAYIAQQQDQNDK